MHVFTGRLIETSIDAGWDVAGRSFLFVRTYNSGDASPPSATGSFGPGWTHTWNRRILDRGAQGVIEVDGRGTGLAFPSDGSGGYLPTPRGGATVVHETDGSWTVTYGTHQRFHYLASGALERITDDAGGVFQLEYAQDGTLSRVLDPAGQALTLEVTGGLIRRITAKNGLTRQYRYTDGRLTETEDTRGFKTTFAYDAASGDLVLIAHATGDRHEYTYADGKVTQVRLVTHMPDATERTSTSSFEYPSEFVRRYTNAVGEVTTLEFDASGREIKRIDPTSREFTITRDTEGRITASTNADGATWRYTYTATGQVATSSLPGGETTTYVRDPVTDWLVGQVNPDGTRQEYTRDAAGNVIAIKDELGRETRYERNAFGRVTKKTDSLGRDTLYTYDADQQLISMQDAAGGTTTYTRDTLGRVTAVTSPEGRITRTQYDGMRQVTATVDGDANTTTYVNDALGRRTAMVEPNGATTELTYAKINAQSVVVQQKDPVGALWKYLFDDLGRQIERIDPLNRTTRTTFDALHRVVRIDPPAGDFVTFTYNQVGLLATSTNARGAVTQYFYDPNKRLIRTVLPDGFEQKLAYDTRSRVVSRTNEEGSTTFTAYDSASQAIAMVDQLGQIVQMDYTSTGRLSLQRDTRDHVTRFSYDSLDRMASTTDPLGFVERREYGPDSQLTARIDKRGARSSMAYDGRLLSVSDTDALGFTVARTHDNVGNTLSVTDENGHAWSYTWDLRHQKTSETDPNGRTTRFEYDAARQLTLVTHPDGTRWRYNRDLAGRITARVLERADGSIEDTETFSFDIVGNPLTTENAQVKITREFDLRDRETKRTTLFKRTGVTRELTFQYDSMGRRKAMADSHGRVVVYSYDRLSRPVEMTLFEPPTVVFAAPSAFRTRTYTFTWDPTSNLTQVTYPNGTRTRREFDAANRLTRLVNERVPATGAPQVLSSFAYERDENGNITKITDDRNQVFEYTYSKRNELTRARMPRSLVARLKARDDARARCEPYRDDDDDDDDNEDDRRRGHGRGTPVDLDYRFDPAGNRIEETREGRSILSTFSPANELLTRDGISYTYDLRGNQTEERLRSGHRQLSRFDVANRMVSLAQATPGHRGRGQAIQELEQYFYDPQNQRIGVRDAKKGRLTQFHWDEGRPVEEWREVARTSRGPRDKGILYLRMAGQLLEQMRFQSIAPRCDPDRDGDDDQGDERDVAFKHLDWIMPDHLGSTSVVADSRGRRMGRALQYGAWGEPLAGKHSRSRFTYTGHAFERATGNYYSVYRYLDPFAGKWTQRDPLGDHDGLNRYQYVHARPLAFTDPLGLTGKSPSDPDDGPKLPDKEPPTLSCDQAIRKYLKALLRVAKMMNSDCYDAVDIEEARDSAFQAGLDVISQCTPKEIEDHVPADKRPTDRPREWFFTPPPPPWWILPLLPVPGPGLVPLPVLP